MSVETQSNLTGLATILSSELNSLASAAYSAAGAAIDNTTNGYVWATFELAVTFASSPGAGGSVTLYLLPSIDGSNHSDGGGSTTPGQELAVWPFSVRSVTSAQRVVSFSIQVPPGKWKPLLYNGASTAFAASGNTLKIAYSQRTLS